MDEHYEIEMSISHQEFYRLLPFGLKGIDYKIKDEKITGKYAGGIFKLIPGDEHKRKIASLELPVLYLTFDFENISSENIEKFFAQFHRAYQRGGG